VWIGETEVTQGQWEALQLTNPSYFEECGHDCPVEQVNWFEAVEFANRLSDREELDRCYELKGCTGGIGEDYTCEFAAFQGLDCNGYRLPTEMEWEIAARAGEPGARYGPLHVIAWYNGGLHGPIPVRGRQANALELYDMLGNVREWCSDKYGLYDADVRPIDREGPVNGLYRVVRGGSWIDDAQSVRAAHRSHFLPENTWNVLGFRLARGQVLRSSEAEPRGR
jgi:formylglycine-generating enzyme required for sulfatase activity